MESAQRPTHNLLDFTATLIQNILKVYIQIIDKLASTVWPAFGIKTHGASDRCQRSAKHRKVWSQHN